MSRSDTVVPPTYPMPIIDPAALNWASGVQHIYFQNSTAPLRNNRDGTYALSLSGRSDKPRDSSDVLVISAYVKSLAACLGDSVGTLKAYYAFQQRMQSLTGPEITACLTRIGEWYVNQPYIGSAPAIRTAGA